MSVQRMTNIKYNECTECVYKMTETNECTKRVPRMALKIMSVQNECK